MNEFPMDDSMIGRWLSPVLMGDPEHQSTTTRRPMLRRFVHHSEPITWHECLGEGVEGAVYRATIAEKDYAVKIFKTFEYKGPPIHERQKHYTYPITNEARAFGRLDSLNENGTWAVKCYGWLKLSKEQNRGILRKKRNRKDFTCWAIVKEYLPISLTLDDVPEISRKASIAKRARLLPDDVYPRNFCGSFLVDLGRVKTYPYIRRFWSESQFSGFYENFETYASKWEVSIMTGKVVDGSTSENHKRLKDAEKRVLWEE